MIASKIQGVVIAWIIVLCFWQSDQNLVSGPFGKRHNGFMVN